MVVVVAEPWDVAKAKGVDVKVWVGWVVPWDPCKVALAVEVDVAVVAVVAAVAVVVVVVVVVVVDVAAVAAAVAAAVVVAVAVAVVVAVAAAAAAAVVAAAVVAAVVVVGVVVVAVAVAAAVVVVVAAAEAAAVAAVAVVVVAAVAVVAAAVVVAAAAVAAAAVAAVAVVVVAAVAAVAAVAVATVAAVAAAVAVAVVPWVLGVAALAAPIKWVVLGWVARWVARIRWAAPAWLVAIAPVRWRQTPWALNLSADHSRLVARSTQSPRAQKLPRTMLKVQHFGWKDWEGFGMGTNQPPPPTFGESPLGVQILGSYRPKSFFFVIKDPKIRSLCLFLKFFVRCSQRTGWFSIKKIHLFTFFQVSNSQIYSVVRHVVDQPRMAVRRHEGKKTSRRFSSKTILFCNLYVLLRNSPQKSRENLVAKELPGTHVLSKKPIHQRLPTGIQNFPLLSAGDGSRRERSRSRDREKERTEEA